MNSHFSGEAIYDLTNTFKNPHLMTFSGANFLPYKNQKQVQFYKIELMGFVIGEILA